MQYIDGTQDEDAALICTARSIITDYAKGNMENNIRLGAALTHSLTYSLTHLLNHLLTQSLTHLLTHSLTSGGISGTDYIYQYCIEC